MLPVPLRKRKEKGGDPTRSKILHHVVVSEPRRFVHFHTVPVIMQLRPGVRCSSISWGGFVALEQLEKETGRFGNAHTLLGERPPAHGVERAVRNTPAHSRAQQHMRIVSVSGHGLRIRSVSP